MSSPESASITGLFLAGLLASLHCAGMCGPLACAACGLGKSGPSSNLGSLAFRRIAGYQLTRVFAYTLLGAIAGAIGSQPLSWLGLSGKPLVLWAAIALIVGAVLVETLIPLRRKIAAATAAKSCKKLRPALSRGSWAVGLATPLLPCGVLYSALGVAALSGGPIIGASLMAAFGLGTIPLLAVAQVQWARWSPALSTSAARYLRLGVAVLFAAALAWRGGLFTPDSAIAEDGEEPNCPMCAKDKALEQ
jgi:sulfite exporter TauE/SafE